MGFELAVANAAGHWQAMAGARGWECVIRPEFTAVRGQDGARVLLTAPPDDPDALTVRLLTLLHEWDPRQMCLEDPYLALDLSAWGREAALTMPVMVRDAAPTPASAGPAGPGPVGRAEAADAAGPVLAAEALTRPDRDDVERVVVEGFPIAQQLPWRRGGQFPEAYARLPGRRSWLARVDGRPAAACVTWDDGTAVGFYWVATLPAERSRGAARALMRAALAAHPDRVATLTATLLGEPLYRHLGFTERGLSRWWR
ncbi:GNAT family N-acetyltransferase [Streptacidiphilus rugosus]|uniref:GNAT family N-acetyltransferase n=1 Tax=Streptacidiphilus rugosus TaxID=405783 RepID=UPI0005681DF4|nr:GNAT family N-acetyltransferase [Streptacidiphilus rugosus]